MKDSIVTVDEAQTTTCRNGVLLTVTDYLTRKPLHCECYDGSSYSPVQALSRIFNGHGFPKTVITDNSRGFTSKEFSAFLAENGCTHKLTSPWAGAPAVNRERQEHM